MDSINTAGTERAEREQGVRKVVRLIIEKNGGTGAAVKPDIETDYTRGMVWWKGDRVAEWSKGGMVLLDKIKEHKSAYEQLMGK